MSRTSDSGAKLIASYRAATSLRPDQRERALRKLQARLSADPTPWVRPEVPLPELPQPLPAAWVQLHARWKRTVTIGKVIVGAALLTWLATEPDPQAGVEHDFVARRAPAAQTGAAAATEPRDQGATAATRGVADGSQRESAPATPVSAASDASSSPVHAPRTDAAAASPQAAIRPGRAPAPASSNAPESRATAHPGRTPESWSPNPSESWSLGESEPRARLARASGPDLADVPAPRGDVRLGRAPAPALSDASETRGRSDRAPALSDGSNTRATVRSDRAPALSDGSNTRATVR
ncbi:MAG TPA: hypothetical protein VMF89_08970, partial [Polyangiales bacterium]|nr:hypothetical protein [Polyangiales bacterium]